MSAAQEHAVVDVGLAMVRNDLFDMVGIAPRRGRSAAVYHAATVAEAECLLLLCGEEPLLVTEVEYFSVRAEHDVPVSGIADESLYCRGGDRFITVVDPTDTASALKVA